jgi:hypothetical protein
VSGVSCPHCAAGNIAAWRESTSEWVHRYSPVLPSGGRQFSITLCVAGTPFVSKAPAALNAAISAREAAIFVDNPPVSGGSPDGIAAPVPG